jgi:hypothetical protein
MPAIVLASRNRKKTQEVSEILAPLGFTVVSVTQFPLVPEVDEDGCTFAENAAKKAREVALHLKQWVIGEDSGLTVDALNGAPEFTRHATAIRGPPMNAIIRNCSRNSATYPTTNEAQVTFAVSHLLIPLGKSALPAKAHVADASSTTHPVKEASVTIHFFLSRSTTAPSDNSVPSLNIASATARKPLPGLRPAGRDQPRIRSGAVSGWLVLLLASFGHAEWWVIAVNRLHSFPIAPRKLRRFRTFHEPCGPHLSTTACCTCRLRR